MMNEWHFEGDHFVSMNNESIDPEDNSEGLNDEEEVSSQILISDPIDYTGYFENLQTIGIVLCALIVAYGVFNAFIHGVIRK